MSILSDVAASLQRGEDDQVAALVRQAIDDKLDASAILHDGLLAGMHEVGEQFRQREIFLPDVLLSARAMYAGLDLLKPLLAKEGVPNAGTIVIGSVQGDLHDIGKNLVGIMLAGAGFEVVDLGNDVPPQRFVDTACDRGASVIGLSALLTTTMPVMKSVVELVQSRGLGDRIKVIVGGAPVSEAWARQIGADAYGYDAASAVERVRALVGKPA